MLIYCIAFLLPAVLSVPAGAVIDGWVKLLGTMMTEHSSEIAIDSTGNVYVTGFTDGGMNGETNAGGEDIFIWRYSELSESFPWAIFYPAIMKKRQ